MLVLVTYWKSSVHPVLLLCYGHFLNLLFGLTVASPPGIRVSNDLAWSHLQSWIDVDAPRVARDTLTKLPAAKVTDKT